MNPYKKHAGGRPSLDITLEQRAQVEVLSGLGLTQLEIGRILGLSKTTIWRHCQEELTRGIAKADAAILNNLKRIAMSDSPQAASAAMFWAKCRRQWREIQRVIHGFDPAALEEFVREFLGILKRQMPAMCPHCQAPLNLAPKISAELKALSTRMIEQLPPDEIVPKSIDLPD